MIILKDHDSEWLSFWFNTFRLIVIRLYKKWGLQNFSFAASILIIVDVEMCE